MKLRNKKGFNNFIFRLMMEITDLLKSERIRMAKKNFQPSFYSYLSNREKALQTIDLKEMKEKLRKIKEESIKHLEALKRKTIENLENQKIKVFEATDAKEACKISLELIPEGETIVKSKSNTIKEIGLLNVLKGRNKIIETDCGDFIVDLCDEESSHPVAPAIHIPLDYVVEKIKEKFGVKLKKNARNVVRWIEDHIKKNILKARIGLTGANVISSEGAIFILENEGNISLVSRIPERHIIYAGIDKIVPSIQDAITICQALGIWGSGINLPTYISVISSPSKTADIQKELVYGAQGAREVFLILIDNGRSKMIEEGLEELLYCINCGSCLYFCPVYRQIFNHYGFHYFGGRGVGLTVFQEGIETAFDRGLYFCTTCMNCKVNCPLDIDIPNIMRKLRKKAVESGFETSVNEKMMENVRTLGNPFGEEVKEGKIPKELYCC